MDKHENAINRILTVGMALTGIRTAITLLMYCFPDPVLKLMQYPGSGSDEWRALMISPLMMLRPLLYFGIMLGLFFLLRSETKKLSALSDIFPILIPAGSVVLSLIGTFTNWGITRLIAIRYGSEALAMNSTISTAASMITIVFSPAILLFAIAAGANWYRRKQMQTT